MSVTAVGPARDLEGPLPVARRFSLLSTPGVVVEDDNRWMNGVNVIGYPAGLPSAWEPCSTGTFRVKDSSAVEGEEEAQPSSRFDPIAVYFPFSCTVRGGRGVQQKLIDRVEAVLDATLSFGVERALVAGTAGSTNPFIGDTGMDVLASGNAVSPQVGQSYLENAIAALTGRQGIIHATPAVVAAWGYGAGLPEDVPPDEEVDDPPPPHTLRTANGTPVISGAGYIGVHPLGSGGLVGPGETTDWVYATGPVEVRVGDLEPTEVEDVIDHASNDIVIRAERYVLPNWDTGLQVGVLIDWAA